MSTPKKPRKNPNKGKRSGKSIPEKIHSAPKGGRPVAKPNTNSDPNSIRLNKYIANSGVCTRRDADLYISTGSVRVNNVVITEMGYRVKLTDEVRFDGQLINPIKKSYILLNKPKGFTISASTTNEKKSIHAITQNAAKSPLKPVGKMERNTSGLLLLSNDDSFLGALNTSGRLRQIYHVELDKNFSRVDFDKILEGLHVDGNVVKVHDLQYIEDSKKEIGIQKTRIYC